MNGTAPAKKAPSFMLTIVVDMETGKVFVDGPLNDKRRCLHALSDAIHIVIEAEESVITRPNGVLSEALKVQ